MLLTKTRIVLTLREVTSNGPLFAASESEHDLSVPLEAWEDMGSPDTLTVTIEPGDLLND